MRTWTYYEVSYQDRTRFSTLDQQEAENYARSLFARAGEVGTPPVIDGHIRNSAQTVNGR